MNLEAILKTNLASFGDVVQGSLFLNALYKHVGTYVMRNVTNSRNASELTFTIVVCFVSSERVPEFEVAGHAFHKRSPPMFIR